LRRGSSLARYGLINSLFDQIVTFRLAELKEAWSSIYEAEKAIEEAKKGKKDVTKKEILWKMSLILIAPKDVVW
jgi:hypothetical protein